MQSSFLTGRIVDNLEAHMDQVGWHDQADQKDYNYAVFKWMREATNEIQRLEREVQSLTRVLHSRTEHLV